MAMAMAIGNSRKALVLARRPLDGPGRGDLVDRHDHAEGEGHAEDLPEGRVAERHVGVGEQAEGAGGDGEGDQRVDLRDALERRHGAGDEGRPGHDVAHDAVVVHLHGVVEQLRRRHQQQHQKRPEPHVGDDERRRTGRSPRGCRWRRRRGRRPRSARHRWWRPERRRAALPRVRPSVGARSWSRPTLAGPSGRRVACRADADARRGRAAGWAATDAPGERRAAGVARTPERSGPRRCSRRRRGRRAAQPHRRRRRRRPRRRFETPTTATSHSRRLAAPHHTRSTRAPAPSVRRCPAYNVVSPTNTTARRPRSQSRHSSRGNALHQVDLTPRAVTNVSGSRGSRTRPRTATLGAECSAAGLDGLEAQLSGGDEAPVGLAHDVDVPELLGAAAGDRRGRGDDAALAHRGEEVGVVVDPDDDLALGGR